ncbi:MAG: hypothetical protein RBG13Loki_3709, partial [Promethearchaeota archaeon CR_4]
QTPTLIITGDQDALFKYTHSQDLHNGISGSKLVVIPKQNHGLFHEVPDLVATELKKLAI